MYRHTAIKSATSTKPGGGATVAKSPYAKVEAELPDSRKSLTDFLEEAREFVGDEGPPRWFSPLECGAQAPGSPLLLFIPGSSSRFFFGAYGCST
ncbi:unnamed protein product [Thlaspi arvense]|uniref:Uncharacterized protein n=1 Tax=Thlaspi arvense TaxID=13288 RepID=A0AAU9RPY7_THLAR|nr:unnamed protein product [Thlaspi arvense]